MNEAAAEVNATILNVDDDEASQYVKTRILRHAGFQVIEADRGSRVIPLMQTHQPDLVLLDVNLPDGSGFDVCRAIKADPNLASTIVVQMSSSFVGQADRIKGLQAGADSYFTEPMEGEELVANVNALLRIRKMELELRRSALEWKKTFEAVRDGVAIVQETGIITRCNPAFEQIAGRAAVDHPIDDILGTKNDEVRTLLTRAAHESSGSSIDMEIGSRTMRLTVDPVLDAQGQVTHFACILSDITAERQIANLNTQLRRTVDNLKVANEAAAAASRSKDVFLATVSHELRTPMTAIIGWAQMLRMLGAEGGNIDQPIDAILSAARAQSQLVEDLLDLSRITTGKLRLEIETFDFAEAAEAAVQTIVPAAMAKRIHVEKHIDSVNVLGDRNRLQQVVWNLLTNAIKFTPDEGSIDISLRVDGTRAILVVRDNGKGIEPEFLSAVFDRFSQAEPGARSGGGLGLGLAIVRHIVELHGGEVTASSEGSGKGATFRVMLPVTA